MSKERLYIFDTTLRDGAQTQGVDFSLEEKEFLLFYDDSNLILAFVETITPNDIDNELKSTLTVQRKEFFKRSLRQNFINNYLNFIKQNTEIKVNERLIESTLLNLQRTS